MYGSVTVEFVFQHCPQSCGVIEVVACDSATTHRIVPLDHSIY